MNTPYIKTGSFRRVLLQALADGAINTIDDLQTRLDEPRKKIQDNIMHAAEAGLIKRLRDDVTGLPAYQISREGRDYLALAEKSVEKYRVLYLSRSKSKSRSPSLSSRSQRSSLKGSKPPTGRHYQHRLYLKSLR